jgi:hypothetical protein
MLTVELNRLNRLLEKLTQVYAKKLRSRFGVGPHTAAILLSVAGNNPEPLKNEALLLGCVV